MWLVKLIKYCFLLSSIMRTELIIECDIARHNAKNVFRLRATQDCKCEYLLCNYNSMLFSEFSFPQSHRLNLWKDGKIVVLFIVLPINLHKGRLFQSWCWEWSSTDYQAGMRSVGCYLQAHRVATPYFFGVHLDNDNGGLFLVGIMVMCEEDMVTPNLFDGFLPKRTLYEVFAFTKRYRTVIMR